MRWKVIPGFKCYEVSERGDVRRCVPARNFNTCMKGNMKLRVTSQGYLAVRLFSDEGKLLTRTVHRFVALAFLGPPPTPLHEVAHGDGSRTNNAVENLRWATRQENVDDRMRHAKPYRQAVGSKHHFSKLTEKQVAEVRRVHSKIGSNSLARLLGVKLDTITKIIRRKNWKHVS